MGVEDMVDHLVVAAVVIQVEDTAGAETEATAQIHIDN